MRRGLIPRAIRRGAPILGLAISVAAHAQSSTNYKMLAAPGSAGGAVSSTSYKLQFELGRQPIGRGSATTTDAVAGFVGGAFSSVANLSIPVAASAYKAVAFPIQAANNAVTAVLSEFGAYDNTAWRIGHFSPVDSAYMEPGTSLNLPTLGIGQGYWLITLNGGTATDVGLPAPQAPFNINLIAGKGSPARPGWNQFGNPFLFPVNVSALVVTDGVTPHLLTDIANTLTENTVKGWNGTAYADVTVLNGRTGYWVRRKAATGTVTLVVPYQSSSSGTPVPQLVTPEGANWVVSLTAREGDRMAEPLHIGTTSLVPGSENPLNHMAAPGPPGQVMLGLQAPKTDWGRESGSYVSEFVATAEHMSWDLVLTGASAPGEVAIDVNAADLPANLWLRLTDVATGEAYDLTPGHTLTVAAYAGDRHYRLEAGSGTAQSSNAASVDAFRLAYPNPFRASTGLTFSLARSADVRLEIFDLQGRLVRSLERPGLSAGEHVLVWDGRDAGGRTMGGSVYLARWHAGATAGVTRLVKVE